MLTPFHIAVQVRDLQEARDFYGAALGLPEGRSSDQWIDFNMFGHQFVVHHNPALDRGGKVTSIANPVDGQGGTSTTLWRGLADGGLAVTGHEAGAGY